MTPPSKWPAPTKEAAQWRSHPPRQSQVLVGGPSLLGFLLGVGSRRLLAGKGRGEGKGLC